MTIELAKTHPLQRRFLGPRGSVEVAWISLYFWLGHEAESISTVEAD